MSDSLSEAEILRLGGLQTQLEFITRDAVAAVATRVPDNYVNHVSVMTGGRGRHEMIEFYGKNFIRQMPADTTLRLLARTVGQNRLIDEFVSSFTHDIEMDWMLPGIPPTHLYWDQAPALVQLGLPDPTGLPVTGVASARKFENQNLPSNKLIRRNART